LAAEKAFRSQIHSIPVGHSYLMAEEITTLSRKRAQQSKATFRRFPLWPKTLAGSIAHPLSSNPCLIT
jgi:4'-phosphopantetheinyl transferase EntD